MTVLPESQISDTARIKRRTREIAYRAGALQRNFRVQRSAVAKIDHLKVLGKIPNRDLTVALLLRKAATLYEPTDIVLVPPLPRVQDLMPVVAMISRELVAFVDDVRALHRNATVGQVLESILAMIPDLDAAPEQLRMPLILKESAVST